MPLYFTNEIHAVIVYNKSILC